MFNVKQYIVFVISVGMDNKNLNILKNIFIFVSKIKNKKNV